MKLQLHMGRNISTFDLKCTPSSAQQCLAPESGLHSRTLGALAPVPTANNFFLGTFCQFMHVISDPNLLSVVPVSRCNQDNV